MKVIKKYKLSVIRKISTRDAMYNIFRIINTSVYYKIVGRLNLKNTSQGNKKKKKLTKIVYLSIGNDRYSLTMFENIVSLWIIWSSELNKVRSWLTLYLR